MVLFFRKRCSKCQSKLTYRVPRKLHHRLIPFSRRYRCSKCEQYYLKIMK